MSKQATFTESANLILSRQERERIHFNKIAERDWSRDLVMPASNILRYARADEHTPFPLEYAFALLGNLKGRSVVDLGCGEGLNTVTLASLGASVTSVDISDKSLELTGERAAANGVARNVTLVHSDAATIPIQDGQADHVLCAAILHHVDCLATAVQIRRILKPGGTAVFLEPLEGPAWLGKIKSLIPKGEGVSEDEQPLSLSQVDRVSRTVGHQERRREFLLTTRLIDRAGIHSWETINRSHRLDAWLLQHVPAARSLASPLVWEARK